jgi:hypothetical protein
MSDQPRRPYIVGPERAKIGSSEIKLSREMLRDIRDRVKAMDGNLSFPKMAEEIVKVYPSSSVATMERYVRVCRVHDEVFNFYMAGHISFGVLDEICSLEPETGKFLVEEMIDRKLLPTHIHTAKALMKQKLAKTWDEALKKAVGEDQPPPLTPDDRRSKSKPARGDSRTFDDLVKDVLYSGTEWRLKVKALIDMLPMAADGAVHSFQTFTKLYMLRHSLTEQLEFVDKTVKGVLDRMTKQASVEADFTEVGDDTDGGNRDQGNGESREGGEKEGEVGELHGPRQVVPHPPDEKEDGG